MYWVDVYTRIIPKQSAFSGNYWYLDLLAGSGTNYIRETNDVIVGSPFIALLFARKPFTRHIFIELNRERARALRRRVEALRYSERVSIYQSDCNTIIPKLNMNAKHFLAFIDCEGLDVNWETQETLLEKRGDIIVVFQTQELQRTLGRAKKGLSDKEKLGDFLGDSSWKRAGDVKKLLEIYMNKLKSYRKYVERIEIRGEYKYDIILACRPGPYTKAWQCLKERYSKLTNKDAELALRMCKGEIRALDEFFSVKAESQQLRLNRFLKKNENYGLY